MSSGIVGLSRSRSACKLELVDWKYSSEDTFIEVVVDPDFGGDIANLAAVRPVWIVDSPLNHALVDAALGGESREELFEVNRHRYADGDDRLGNLIQIIGCLDDHHPHHNLII